MVARLQCSSLERSFLRRVSDRLMLRRFVVVHERQVAGKVRRDLPLEASLNDS